MALYLKDATFIDWQACELRKTCLVVEKVWTGHLFLERVPHQRIFQPRPHPRLRGKACHQVLRLRPPSHLLDARPRHARATEDTCQFRGDPQYIWWHLDKCLDLEMIEASALASAMYCVKNGVTLIIDHHASPFAVNESLSTIARAFDRVASPSALLRDSDRDGEGVREEGLAETDAFLASGHQGHVGLHASFTVGDELLRKAVALAHKHATGLHMHVAEDPVDQEETQKRYGQR